MIGIIGGGNIGVALCGELSRRSKDVLLYTNRGLNGQIVVSDDSFGNHSFEPNTTSSIEEFCDSCDVMVLTYPSFKFKEFNDIATDHIREGTIIVVLPGIGGAEFALKGLVDKGGRLVGLQRVPAVYRYNVCDNVATIRGRRKEGLFISSIPLQSSSDLVQVVSDVFDMPVSEVPNYLNITLTPSNPILHTCRLYSLFKGCDRGTILERGPLFYGEWDLDSSELLIACNDELFDIMSHIDLDLSGVRSLLDHYESVDAQSLMEKIRSIPSLNSLGSPVVACKGGFRIDFDSRYFTADFPNGLLLLKSMALLVDVPTPTIDKVMVWYQGVVDKEYLVDGALGPDSKTCNLPQNYGIVTVEDLIEYYK